MKRTLYILLLILAAALAPVCNADLVEHWLLNEGSGIVLNSNGSWSTPLYLADGTENWVSTPGEQGINTETSYFDGFAGWGSVRTGTGFNNFTIAAFVYVDSSAGGMSGINDIFIGGEAEIRLYLNNGYLYNDSWGLSVQVPADQWIHIAYVATGNSSNPSAEQRMYINGQHVETQTSQWTPSNGMIKKVRLGAYDDITGQNFKGVIDELAVYSSDLTDTEILDLYNQGPVGGGIELSIDTANVLYWQSVLNQQYRISYRDSDLDPYTEIGLFNGTGGIMSFVDTGDIISGRSNPGLHSEIERSYTIEIVP